MGSRSTPSSPPSDYKTGEWITVLETLCRLNWEQLVAILSQSNVKEFHWLG